MEEPIQNLSSSEAVPGSFKPVNKILLAVPLVVVLGLGIFSGWWFAGRSGGTASGGTGIVPKENIAKGAEFGTTDVSSFPDKAIGVLEKGGLDGEGTHKLIREGGPSQTVYLTSSILDLDQFTGKKIEIWGATMTAQKAGWLMDVGKIKVLE